MRFRPRAGVPLALFCVALALRSAIALGWGFAGLYGQDAYAYWRQGLAFGALLCDGTPLPDGFLWPNGYPALIGLATLVGGARPIAAQLVSLLAGAAIAPLVWGMTRALVPDLPRAALLAGLCAAVSGEAVLSSIVVMSDAPALAFGTLTLFFLARATGSLSRDAEPSVRRDTAAPAFIAAALSLAAAVLMRWTYALLVPVVAGAVLFARARTGRPRFGALVFAGALAAGIVVPVLVAAIDRPRGLLTHGLLTGWSPFNAFASSFETENGRAVYAVPNLVFYLYPLGHPGHLFPLFGCGAIFGFVSLWRARAWHALAVLGGALAAFFVFLAGVPQQSPRFALPLLPPVCALAGIGLARLRRRTRRTALVDVLVVAGLGVMLVWSLRISAAFIPRMNARIETARVIGDAVPAGATLVSFDLTATLQHELPARDVLELFYLTEKALRGLIEADAPLYLAIDRRNLETQWRSHAVAGKLRWLEANADLTVVARHPPFALYLAREK